MIKEDWNMFAMGLAVGVVLGSLYTLLLVFG